MIIRPAKLSRYAQRVYDIAEHDEQLQQLLPDADVLEAIMDPALSVEQIIAGALAGYAERPAFGERDYEVVRDPVTERDERRYVPTFATVTYGELDRRVRSLVSAWNRHPLHRVAANDFVCILGFGGIDFVTVDLACCFAHAVNVPLQTTLGGSDLDGIFANTAPTAVAATVADLVVAARMAKAHSSIRSIIVFDYDERITDDRDELAAAKAVLAGVDDAAQFVLLNDLVAFGADEPWQPTTPPVRDDERMLMLLHSSGSTGTPKGAIILERTARAQITSLPQTAVPLVRVCFAPLNHFMGRSQVFTGLARGGTVFFTAKNDMSTLFEDFRLVRPTEASMFPRIMEMIHRHYLGEVARRSSDDTDLEAVRDEVKREMGASFLGDRISLITSGAAPTAPEVQRFLLDCFPISLADGYGTTEAGGYITMRDHIVRPPVIDYKLRDVPELGYFTTDKPYPRGELCVTTHIGVPGYFKRPEATAALIDEDGYLCTGDIMEERGPDHVVYIDRRNDVLKLAQGEFVAAGALGNMYETASELIYQMYMYGNSARSYLLAVIVPDLTVATKLLGEEPSPAALSALIRSELKQVAEAKALRTFEVPREFIVELEPFSHENGLLSSVHKRMRPNFERKYGDRLEQLYTDLEQQQYDELIALRRPDSTLTVGQKIASALRAVLGLADTDFDDSSTFAELGGDSLGAVELTALFEEIFGVDLPLNDIVSPAGNPRRWAATIERALDRDRHAQPSFAQIHGKSAQRLYASDLDIERFLGDADLSTVPTDEPPAESRVVLITGATGFLGRFLCLEWMEQVGPTGKVICLVRAADHNTAQRRLAAGFDQGDAELSSRFAALAAERLEVVVGDVTERLLGLDEATYSRLAAEVDRIVHPAALVNHVLDYEHLFGPNVVGTAEVARLALTTRQKRIDFVSSLAAARLVEREGGVTEDSPLQQAITLSNEYTAGYGASKWAAEHVLHSAHRRFGVPVNVFRGDMMLPDRRFRGQINPPDIFIRLLQSLVITGLAPASFYTPIAGSGGAHYDGLPVDFIAAAIVGVGRSSHREIRTFHVVNDHHDDGISLDTFVDWIEAAGYPMQRVAMHDEWVRRIEARLQALPTETRQQSVLGVLEAYRRPFKATAALAVSDHFAAAVASLPIGPRVPHLTREYIEKCLEDLRARGLIDSPSTR
ncbi:MAG: AMP-binding protein [Actinobacteria bacterium]|uniref:Unannotated protein n=1 Tax=freshwater metagenome TaxID=449393 RepID=A0A6J7M5S2_9ZZZZ|nr:AMP-binding protein [Actinomycetota bacterium]